MLCYPHVLLRRNEGSGEPCASYMHPNLIAVGSDNLYIMLASFQPTSADEEIR